MNKFFLIFFVLTLSACGSTKTVLICGDHVCINNKEADQYFKENLTIEVKIIDNKNYKKINLVELNLKDSSSNKNISIIKKDKTKSKIKTLSKNEIEKIKRDIKIKEKTKKAEKKVVTSNHSKKLKVSTGSDQSVSNISTTNKTQRINNKELVDICSILKKCTIDEISNYLLKKGKNKKFPDITLRE